MKNGLYSVALVAGLVAALPQAGAAFTSRGGTKVNPVNAAIFEVVPKTGGSGGVFWCGAADFAQRQMKAPWQARIFVARGRGPSVTTGKRSAVQFTLDPAAAGIQPAESSLSVNEFAVGESMSVQQAFYYCQKQALF
ncbi:hypothetical protein ACFMPD_04025 [Sedimentitalea sp. HM32M-2]|uniref:hypothetical protein n=1 Tax=Sedimentitalea sp. HM32M-2 TaxID=3351566 RepID=UPI003644174B